MGGLLHRLLRSCIVRLIDIKAVGYIETKNEHFFEISTSWGYRKLIDFCRLINMKITKDDNFNLMQSLFYFIITFKYVQMDL